MTATNGASISAWLDTAAIPRFTRLNGDETADVCVIGAGIAGLTCAYVLTREGKSVVVLDALGVGAGETGRTTAHFFPPDERYFHISERFGFDTAAQIADSYRAATEQVASIVASEGIACEFSRLDGYLVHPAGQWDETLEREHRVTRQLGLRVERVDRVPGLPFDSGPALRFADQAQFHPLKYLAGLATAVVRTGGRLYDHSRALQIDHRGEAVLVKTEFGAVSASAVIVATNTPFNDRVVMHTKQAAYRTYVLGVRVPKGAVPPLLLWDTGDPYYYLRLAPLASDPAHELLIVGGQDHKSGQDDHPQHRYDEIEAWIRSRFAQAGEVAYRWSGEVMEPADGLAFLGRNPMDSKNVYIVTGDSGNGMTHCTAGAILITDLIMKRPSVWADVYDPARKPVHGVADFFSEQANTIGKYADWLRPADVESVAEIPVGEGATVRHGAKLFAVYRNDDGGLQTLSAACTHLGCAVHWNGAEKTWDCPCHGSRFDRDGTALHGPANASLAAAELPPDVPGLVASEPGAQQPGSNR